MPATVSNRFHDFSPSFVFFLLVRSVHVDVIVNASLSSILFFNLAGAVALNIIYFLVNAIDGLRGGEGLS